MLRTDNRPTLSDLQRERLAIFRIYQHAMRAVEEEIEDEQKGGGEAPYSPAAQKRKDETPDGYDAIPAAPISY
jgi:hypothetical protein